MADLNLAVRLRFLTMGEEKLKASNSALSAFKNSLQKLSAVAGRAFSSNVAKATTTTARLHGALDKASTSSARAARGLDKIGREAKSIDATRASVDRMANSIAKLTHAQSKARASAGGVNPGGASDLINPETVAGGAALALGRAVAPAGTAYAAVRAAKEALYSTVDFETEMAEVKKKVNLPDGKSWKDITNDIDDLALSLGIARVEIAKIMAQGGQGNVPYEQLKGFAELSAKVSAAWDISAQDAAQMMTEVRGATRWDNAGLKTFAEKVNYLGDISPAAEKNIGSMWQRASEGAKAAGMSYDDSMVALTALRGVGMQEDVAARFLGAMTSKLRSPDKKARLGLTELGLSPKGVERGMERNSLETVISVLERLAKARNKVAIARDLGGGEWFDELLRFAGAKNEIIRLRDALKDTDKWRGSLDKSLAISLDTTQKRFDRVKVEVSQIGDLLSRWTLEPIKNQLDGLIERWVKLNDVMRSTGFLSGGDGGPIEKAKRVTPIPLGAKNRELFLHQKSSSADTASRIAGINNLPQPATGDQLDRARNAIAAIESAGSGDYAAKGPRTKSGDKAYGRYQVMGKNIARWSEAATGKRLSVDEFMSNPKAQDTIFNHVFGGYIKKYGNVSDAASMWFTGDTLSQGKKKRDILGTSGSGYVRKFLRHFISPTLSGERPEPISDKSAPVNSPSSGKRGSISSPIHIGQAHFHGVRDPAGMHRQLTSIQNRAIRSARDGALHDIA